MELGLHFISLVSVRSRFQIKVQRTIVILKKYSQLLGAPHGFLYLPTLHLKNQYIELWIDGPRFLAHIETFLSALNFYLHSKTLHILKFCNLSLCQTFTERPSSYHFEQKIYAHSTFSNLTKHLTCSKQTESSPFFRSLLKVYDLPLHLCAVLDCFNFFLLFNINPFSYRSESNLAVLRRYVS